VLEHIPEQDIEWNVDEIFSVASRFVFAVAACYPANKMLPDGSNAHCSVFPPQWWQWQFSMAAERHPRIVWMLLTEQRATDYRKGDRTPRSTMYSVGAGRVMQQARSQAEALAAFARLCPSGHDVA
jgi:hypothetical protein